MINSYEFIGAQTEINPQLLTTLKRYQCTAYQRPIPTVQIKLFEQLLTRLQSPMILDSGCGTGVSSQYLGQKFPDHLIVGIDKSAYRLNKNALFQRHKIQPHIAQKDNIVLVQAELIDMWRLLASEQIVFEQHYLLYPNPWPKPKQLKRRFHAHPVFGQLLGLSNQLICRSNWLLYLQEMQHILAHCYQQEATINQFLQGPGITRFEKKYLKAAVPLYELRTVIV